MTDSMLTPDIGPPFVFPFGYDGAGFFGLRVDTSGVVVPALRTSLPWDRQAVSADIKYSGGVAAHAATIRAEYTVPAGCFGLLTWGCLSMNPVPATGAAYARIFVRENIVMFLPAASTTPLWNLTAYMAYAIPLLPGDLVRIRTLNDSATTITYVLSCGITVFNR